MKRLKYFPLIFYFRIKLWLPVWKLFWPIKPNLFDLIYTIFSNIPFSLRKETFLWWLSVELWGINNQRQLQTSVFFICGRPAKHIWFQDLLSWNSKTHYSCFLKKYFFTVLPTFFLHKVRSLTGDVAKEINFYFQKIYMSFYLPFGKKIISAKCSQELENIISLIFLDNATSDLRAEIQPLVFMSVPWAGDMLPN